MYSERCAAITTNNFRTCSLPQERNLIPITSLPFHPSFKHQATINRFSICIDFPIWDIAYEWSYTICGLYNCLLSLSTFSRFIHTVASIPFYWWIIFHCMDIPHFYLSFNLLVNILLFFHILAILWLNFQGKKPSSASFLWEGENQEGGRGLLELCLSTSRQIETKEEQIQYRGAQTRTLALTLERRLAG